MKCFSIEGTRYRISNYPDSSDVALEPVKNENGLITLKFSLSFPEETIPEGISIQFCMPCAGIYSLWNPCCEYSRGLPPDWAPMSPESRAVSGAPVQSLIGKGDTNRITFAVSDVVTAMRLKAGISEETSELVAEIEFFTKPTHAMTRYETLIRIDTRSIPFYESIIDVRKWWAEDMGYKNAYVPETAKSPMYSTWYSFHQNLDVDAVVEQCRLSKQFGCEAVIVDDGWQTDDSSRGYAYCGDWNACSKKIPDMKDFVDRIHNLGMKFILWYSVPFVGKHSAAWSKFYDKFLDDPKENDWCRLDPRYSEVREHLISLYERAVIEWGLDGFKLDFIDSFMLFPHSSHSSDDGRDFDSLEEAIETLLDGIMKRLRALKPDICIEFRQKYMGPLMQTYGNMIRVTDCPVDPLRHRIGVLDLKMTSGSSAVHSDMLIWNEKEEAEDAALQLISVLGSVPQLSLHIDKLPERHLKMLGFYMSFWNENKDVLLDGNLRIKNPEANYTLFSVENNDKMVAAAYVQTPLTITDNTPSDVYFINGTGEPRLLIEISGKSNPLKYTTLDCVGNVNSDGVITSGNGIFSISVPKAGMIHIEAL